MKMILFVTLYLGEYFSVPFVHEM